MVHTLTTHRKEKTVDVELDIHNIYDIINGLNILVGQKEEDCIKYNNDPIDKEQCERYRKLLAEMQAVKAKLK